MNFRVVCTHVTISRGYIQKKKLLKSLWPDRLGPFVNLVRMISAMRPYYLALAQHRGLVTDPALWYSVAHSFILEDENNLKPYVLSVLGN